MKDEPMRLNRRSMLAGLGGAIAGTTGVASAGGAAGDRDDVVIDVTVWATPDVLDYGPDLDPRAVVADQLRATLRTLANHADAIDAVDVSVGADPVTGVDDSVGTESLNQWIDAVHEGDDMADDSNLLLHGAVDSSAYAGSGETPTCHLSEDGSCQANENAAIVHGAKRFYDPFDRLPGSRLDPDADGYWEDVNGDGRADIVDVQWLFDNQDDIARPLLVDYNGDGALNVGDVQKLYTEASSVDAGTYSPRTALEWSGGFGRRMCVAIHEVGHNIGLQHDMGEAKTAVFGGEEHIVISPMLGSYYYSEDGPSGGDTNRFGDAVESGTDPVFSFLFSEGIHANADDVVYDEVSGDE